MAKRPASALLTTMTMEATGRRSGHVLTALYLKIDDRLALRPRQVGRPLRFTDAELSPSRSLKLSPNSAPNGGGHASAAGSFPAAAPTAGSAPPYRC
jgi:hypothetical protein